MRPRSHCRSCNHTLAWWENVPLVSWMALRGRCRGCRAWIGWRYPLVELAVGILWADCWLRYVSPAANDGSNRAWLHGGAEAIGFGLLFWLLVGLSALDAEHLWLPDAVTLPGILLGVAFSVVCARAEFPASNHPSTTLDVLEGCALGIAFAAGLVLLIRWVYLLVRHREGIGLGDAKLMALLAAWLGLPGALLALVLGVVIGTLVALVLLAVLFNRAKSENWAASKLPLGTFLCVGGIVSALWGQQIIGAYLRWAGL